MLCVLCLPSSHRSLLVSSGSQKKKKKKKLTGSCHALRVLYKRTIINKLYVWSSHIARVYINRVRLPFLHVASRTGKMNISLSAFAPENFVSRDGFGGPTPRQSAHLHTQAEYGAYLSDSSRVPRQRPFIYFKPPYAIGSIPCSSGHAIAYRWRSLPRVRRHGASKPQGSFERVLPWQVTMDQGMCASLSHTHYWYEVGMLKVLCTYCTYLWSHETEVLVLIRYIYIYMLHRTK